MAQQLQLRHFNYFMAVADELHFRKAAIKLSISQPGLSRQIKQLEEILEVQLFLRKNKKVSLTPAGTYLKGEIEYMFNHLEQTKNQLQLIEAGNFGEVRIGFLGSAMQSVIPDLFSKLRYKFPGIKTKLEEMGNGLQIESILKNKLDIGFVRLKKIPQGLTAEPVFKDSFSVVMSESYPMLTRDFVGIEQLASEPFVLFSKEYSPTYYDTVMDICQDAGFKPNVVHKSVNAHTIMKMVENNLGVSVVPTSLQFGFHMKVKFIKLKNIPQRTVLSVLWKEDNRNPALGHCLDLLLNR